MNKIADYDTYDYDYSTYWGKREYEHKSEVLVLEKLLKNKEGEWFVDIGGSFGRLTGLYYKKYSNPVIVDYSLKTLQKNYSRLKRDFPDIQLIAANAYFLPFRNNTFEAGLMVRVLHHIQEQKKYTKEISRIINSGGIYIQEYANKVHIKAVIRALLTFNLSFFNRSVYQQPDKHNYEGTKEGSKVLFLNYHPRYIYELFKENNLDIKVKYGCSFLRINFLKRLLGCNVLLFWENIFQETLSWANISPSIFVMAEVKKENVNPKKFNTLNDILLCPKCKGELKIDEKRAVCMECKTEYLKKENIWDFRI